MRWAWSWLGLLVAMALGCGGNPARGARTPTAPTAKAPRPACPAAKGGAPTFCLPDDNRGAFVVGLAPGHGWQRGQWVELGVERPGLPGPIAAAIAVVTEPYANLARVRVLYQRETKLADATARPLTTDDRARLGKFVGRVQKAEGGRVRLDVGKSDGVAVGDEYALRAGHDDPAPVGRVRVTELGDLYAWASVLEAEGPTHPGQAATFLDRGEGATLRAPVAILVVNFDPLDEQSADEAKAGRSLAKQLADALGKAAGGPDDKRGVSVRYEGNARVRAAGADGDAEARALGRRFGASLVVWGTMRCGEKACAQPRFTVVDPARLKQPGYAGAELWAKKDEAGFRLEGGAPAEPVALAAAILGSLAYEAQQYADAAYYLGKALRQGGLRGEDELKGRHRLAHALFVRGQTVEAREQAASLVEAAQKAGEGRWVQNGRAELARLDVQEGKVGAARAHLEAMRAWAAAHDDAGELGLALHALALLEVKQGRVDRARELYAQSLALSKRIGYVQLEAATLSSLATLEENQGRVAEARSLYAQSLTLTRSIGDVAIELATLVNLAALDFKDGQHPPARKRLEHALARARALGHAKYLAGALD